MIENPTRQAALRLVGNIVNTVFLLVLVAGLVMLMALRHRYVSGDTVGIRFAEIDSFFPRPKPEMPAKTPAAKEEDAKPDEPAIAEVEKDEPEKTEAENPEKPKKPKKPEKIDWKNTEIVSSVPGAYAALFRSRAALGLCVGREYIRVYKNVATPETTPVGDYRILARETENGAPVLILNYPTTADARKALAAGRIEQGVMDRIQQAALGDVAPPFDTPLGGPLRLIVAGQAGPPNAIDVTLRKAELEELARALKVGSTVRIRE